MRVVTNQLLRQSCLICLFWFALAGQAMADDAFLRCKGQVGIHRTTGIQIEEKQELVAHISGGTISFSGNKFLIGESIPMCSPAKAQAYFDSETCEGNKRYDRKRKYGTFNRVTGALDITNEMADGELFRIDGTFICAKAKPLIN